MFFLPSYKDIFLPEAAISLWKLHPTWRGLQLTNTTCSLSGTAKKYISFTWLLLLCLNYIQWAIWRHYLCYSFPAAVAVWPLLGIIQDMNIWRSLEVACAWQSLVLPTATLASRDTPASCPVHWLCEVGLWTPTPVQPETPTPVTTDWEFLSYVNESM